MGRGRGSAGARGGGGGAATAAAAAGAEETQARVTYLGANPEARQARREEVLAEAAAVFRRPITERELATLAGAPDDALVFLSAGSGTLELVVSGPAGSFQAERMISRDDAGRLVLYNALLMIDPAAQGRGLGVSILARQVEAAARQGIDRLETEAARGPTMVGYKVWPKLGYDGPLPANYRASLPNHLQGATKVSDLMKSDAGRAWWDKNGATIELSFDVKPGSYSRRTLDAYMRHKGLK